MQAGLERGVVEHVGHETDPQRLLGEHGAGRQQPLHRPWQPDQARQHPANTMLGHQPATREHRCQLGTCAGVADIAVQGEHDANAGGSAVQAAENWLGYTQQIAVAALEIATIGQQAGTRGCDRAPCIAVGRTLQRLDVDSGAEGSTGAG
ncbi:hypothetical protein D9M72_493160 [compost metagenome]